MHLTGNQFVNSGTGFLSHMLAIRLALVRRSFASCDGKILSGASPRQHLANEDQLFRESSFPISPKEGRRWDGNGRWNSVLFGDLKCDSVRHTRKVCFCVSVGWEGAVWHSGYP